MKIYNNILELKNIFDIFIFDAFGVFWDGSKLYENSNKVMENLVDEGKTVCILSNSPNHKAGMEVYNKKGLIQGKHFNYFITSGIVLRNFLESEKLDFKNNKNPKNVYILGLGGDSIFEGTKYKVVDNLNKADFVYVFTPKLTEKQYNEYKNKEILFEAVSEKERVWNSITIEPFVKQMDEVIKRKMPILNGNPDMVARSGIKGTNEFIFAVRGGSIVEYLRNHDTEIVEFGKPHKITYDFALNYLKNNGVNIENKSRICMIGDTLRTDIKGANIANIKSVLCCETGITANEIQSGNKIEDLLNVENVFVDYFIKGVAINFVSI